MSSDIIIGDCLFCIALALVHILNSGWGGGGMEASASEFENTLYYLIGFKKSP